MLRARNAIYGAARLPALLAAPTTLHPKTPSLCASCRAYSSGHSHPAVNFPSDRTSPSERHPRQHRANEHQRWRDQPPASRHVTGHERRPLNPNRATPTKKPFKRDWSDPVNGGQRRREPSGAQNASPSQLGLTPKTVGLQEDDADVKGGRSPRGAGRERDRRRDPKGRDGIRGRRSQLEDAGEEDLQASRKGRERPGVSPAKEKVPEKKLKQVKAPEKKREVSLPPYITVGSLAKTLDVKMHALQTAMSHAGFTDLRPDCLLTYADAELLVGEFDYLVKPLSTASADFDVYPSPPLPEAERSKAPLRPPVVTVMGHVDHGKTTLLDTLRSASVAAGEAGGITQHIGAFSVPVTSRRKEGGKSSSSNTEGVDTVTFLDTPGHAAFSAMRSRGAAVTDIVVLVVAADDGVMPQTKEVIDLVNASREEASRSSGGGGGEENQSRKAGVQLVVALNKVDKPDADPELVKRELLSEGVNLEDFGGDIPCVPVSGKTGEGLELLEETLAALAEMADLRAERSGVPAEGWVLESRVEKGRGNTATVLVRRGSLSTGDIIVAGNSWAKVRALIDGSGKIIKGSAGPGDPIVVTGWKELPMAGDEVLAVVDAPDGSSAESLAKKAVETRKAAEERRKLMQDVEVINQGRKLKAEEEEAREKSEYEERKRRREARAAGMTHEQIEEMERKAKEQGGEADAETSASQAEPLQLNLIVKADFSGTVEAVVGAIESIGNSEVRVKIVAQGVGEPSEGDVATAQAVGGHIIGFNVRAPRSIQNLAARSQPPVKVHCDDVIYRLMSHVTSECAALLPPVEEVRVTGEASIAAIFSINTKGRQFRNVAGCRVTNGVVGRNSRVRILRDKKGAGADDEDQREVVWEGRLDSLKHVKKEVDEMRKGTECGLSFDGFDDIKEGDVVQCFHTVTTPRTTLY